MARKLNRGITLPAVAWKMLKEVLNSGGWATTPRLITVAGRMDAEDRITLPEIPKPLTKEADEAWCKKPISIELSAREIETCTTCVRHFIEKGAFGANKWSHALITEFIGDE
jgi:hypothetical protein